mmetsp:Transcript_34875/g.69598  ORF Transcript_34875/g.69598 Transcript_34875/m.69598 type:complete len:553 (-) Transcript_34875:1296-2954(-)
MPHSRTRSPATHSDARAHTGEEQSRWIHHESAPQYTSHSTYKRCARRASIHSPSHSHVRRRAALRAIMRWALSPSLAYMPSGYPSRWPCPPQARQAGSRVSHPSPLASWIRMVALARSACHRRDAQQQWNTLQSTHLDVMMYGVPCRRPLGLGKLEEQLLAKSAGNGDDGEGVLIFALRLLSAAHVRRLLSRLDVTRLLHGRLRVEERVHLLARLHGVVALEQRAHLVQLEVRLLAVTIAEPGEEATLAVELRELDELRVALDEHLAALPHGALDPHDEFAEALPVARLQPADALMQQLAALANANRPVGPDHMRVVHAAREQAAESGDAASEHCWVVKHHLVGCLPEQQHALTPIAQVALRMLGSRVLWRLAELDQHRQKHVMSRRHMQLHLQGVEDVDLHDHQRFEVVRVVADVDEVVHVGDHDLLVLARQAERADANELERLALNFHLIHVSHHEVARNLQRARHELELEADHSEPVVQDRPHAPVEVRLRLEEVEARRPLLRHAHVEEAWGRRHAERQIARHDLALLVQAIEVRVAERVGGGDPLHGL